MTKLLNRDDILKTQDIRTEKVDMRPFGWPGAVVVRGMTALERGEVEYAMGGGSDPDSRANNHKRFRALMLVRCIVDGAGANLFNDDDIEALGSKSAAAMDHLTDIAQRLSGYRQIDLDITLKNLPEGRSEDSTSD
jgi:hypothetical protein